MVQLSRLPLFNLLRTSARVTFKNLNPKPDKTRCSDRTLISMSYHSNIASWMREWEIGLQAALHIFLNDLMHWTILVLAFFGFRPNCKPRNQKIKYLHLKNLITRHKRKRKERTALTFLSTLDGRFLMRSTVLSLRFVIWKNTKLKIKIWCKHIWNPWKQIRQNYFLKK